MYPAKMMNPIPERPATVEELKELDLVLRATQYGRYPMWWKGHKCRLVEGPNYRIEPEGTYVDVQFEVLD